MSVEIYCIRGDGSREKSSIKDSLLSSENAAVERGTYEINRQWYFIHSQTLSVPFKKANDSTMLMDDDVVSISDSILGISGNRKVKDITISGSASELKMALTLEKFEEYL